MWWSNRLLFFSLSLSVAAGIRFSKSFLHTKDYLPKLHRVLTGLTGIMILEGILLFFLSFSIIPPLLAVTSVVSIFILFVSGVFCWKSGAVHAFPLLPDGFSYSYDRGTVSQFQVYRASAQQFFY
ncbi:MAG: hypothetical protein GY749_15110 [Desulfobacteraceae bacterium]|nr:hypothetical protein [Desulfobacteraceae bacterium]